MPDWEAIVAREGPAAWRVAYRILGNRADADECFQEVCLAALEVSRRETVWCWPALLRRLAVARALDRRRSGLRHGTVASLPEDGSVPDQSATPPQEAEAAELAERLRTALASLPPLQAEAFCLHSLEAESYAEVAAQLGVSVDHVGVLLHRARARLRELLGKPTEVSP